MGCCSSTLEHKEAAFTGIAHSVSSTGGPSKSSKAPVLMLPLPPKPETGKGLSTGPAIFKAPTAAQASQDDGEGYRFLLHNVKLEKSQLMRLPSASPLRVLLGAADISDRSVETNTEIACEVRVFAPRATLTVALFPESSFSDSKTTSTVKGELRGSRPSWLFGEEVAFEGHAVSEERRAEGHLQAQVVLLERPSGNRIAATSQFKVPTEGERRETLWGKAMFSAKQVGHITVAAGWVGPELVGWLSGEVLRRASFGRWDWVVETLDAMGPRELQELASGSCDSAGRSVLDYVAMSAVEEPQAAKVLSRLLQIDLDFSAADQEGLTALHYASFAGAPEAVVSLLKAQAQPDVQAAGGVTPLMLAALAGSLSCARELLEAGASAAACDDRGQTAATWVCLGCGEPPSRSGRQRLLNNGPEEFRAMAGISNGLHEALDRRRSNGASDPWGGPDRRQLFGELVESLCTSSSFDGPGSPSGAAAAARWLPLMKEASRPGPVRCGCFSELYSRLRRRQGFHIPVLGAVLRAAIADGRHWGEQLCRMLLREAGELPVSGRLSDGRSIVEAALDLGWDEVALMLCDRGATLDSDLAGQARALRAAVEGGHRELAKRLIGQWAEERDAWSRPAAPEAEGLAECPVCFRPLCESGPAVLFDASGRRACGHFLCSSCASELCLQSSSPRCPVCRQAFQPPAQRPPDPREDPAAWFAFFDEEGTGYLDRQLLERVLPAVVPVDAGRLEASLRGDLWLEWDVAGEGRVSRKAFCAERGLLRWLAEHLEELQEERARGPPPLLDEDREGWFRHWVSSGTKEMGKAEVLRAVLKSCGTSSLEAAAVAASREWIERCWLLWDRAGSGRISLEDFCAEGGLADMMLQQSALASAKRIVRRMELELHDPAALVACCQQLVECAVGIRPEDPVEGWAETACRRLRERAAQPAREEFESVLRSGARQVVLAMKRNSSSAKLFAWGCRALTALSFGPPPPASAGLPEIDFSTGNSTDREQTNSSLSSGQLALDKFFQLLHTCPATSTPLDNSETEVPHWRFVLQTFLSLLPSEEHGSTRQTPAGPLPLAPGALREAGLCALGAVRALCDQAGPLAVEEAFEEIVQALCKKDAGPRAALLAWAAAATATLAADARALAGALLQSSSLCHAGPKASAATLIPCLGGLLAAFASGQKAQRPPETSQAAAKLMSALLASLRALPASARSGAGGGAAAPGGDGLPRAQITLRNGHIAVGDVVRLHSDLDRAKREQEPPEHFGGWCDRMAFCLDFPGRVVEIPRRASRLPEVLRISHGALGCWCWNAKAVAEVVQDAGLLPFEEGECGPGAALTIGDEVRIDVNVEEAKTLQVNHGGWNDRMTQCCGRVGRLEAIDKAGDMKVLVPGVGAFVWNPAALRSLHAQRWELALCERLSGPIEATLPLALLSALASLGSRLDTDGLKAALAELVADASSCQGGGFEGWTTLAAATLVMDPALASQSFEEIISAAPAGSRDKARIQHKSAPLKSLLRPGTLSVLQEAKLPGAKLEQSSTEAQSSKDALTPFGDAGLSQLLQGWWEELPAWERRARAV